VDEEPIINRDEALGVLFNVADVADILRKLYKLLGGEEEEETDE